MTENEEKDLELEQLDELSDESPAADAPATDAPAPAEAAPAADAAPASDANDASPTQEAAAATGGEVQGQWVWQYGAPPPAPPWSARFFSGAAVKDLYRFFACGLLVVIGCLLPWGPVVELEANDPLAIVEGGPELIEVIQMPPPTAGYEWPLGALSLVIGLWLVFSSAYGIYTNRQKILPVFLMIEPALVSWSVTLDSWEMVESTSTLDQIQELFMVAGTGVMLTLVGSTYVALNFLMVVVKVYAKKDDKASGRRGGKGGKDKGDKKGKGKKDAKAKKDEGAGDDEAGADGDKDGKDAKGKGRRGRRR